MQRVELVLKHERPFAIGGTRLCYIHPEHSDRCIKVLRRDRRPSVRRRLTRGIKRYRPLQHFDDQVKEVLAYRELQRRRDADIWRHVPEFFGTVWTDQGPGIITKLIRNADDKLPQTLETELAYGMNHPLHRAIERFNTWLREKLVLTRGLLPHNIIVVYPDDRSCRLVIVDGLGNPEWIPISQWSETLARRKIERRIEFFDDRISQLIAVSPEI